MSLREEPSSVFDADIKEGRLKLADGQHPLNRGRSGEMNRLCRLDSVAVAQQRRFGRCKHRCVEDVAHGEPFRGPTGTS